VDNNKYLSGDNEAPWFYWTKNNYINIYDSYAIEWHTIFIFMFTTRLAYRFAKSVPVVDVTSFLAKKGDTSA